MANARNNEDDEATKQRQQADAIRHTQQRQPPPGENALERFNRLQEDLWFRDNTKTASFKGCKAESIINRETIVPPHCNPSTLTRRGAPADV